MKLKINFEINDYMSADKEREMERANKEKINVLPHYKAKKQTMIIHNNDSVLSTEQEARVKELARMKVEAARMKEEKERKLIESENKKPYIKKIVGLIPK